MPNEQAKTYYNVIPNDKRIKFRKKVLELTGWSARQFRNRFLKGEGWEIGDAYMISQKLDIPITSIYPQKQLPKAILSEIIE